MSKIERRLLGSRLELRANGEGKMPTIRAYAVIYGQKSENLGSTRWEWYEIIEPGAARESVLDQSNDIVCLFNHDPNNILGRRSAGNCLIGDDESGVWFEVTPADTSYARDLIENIRAGNVKGCSFAFEVLTDRDEVMDGKDVRRVIKLRLADVSLVTTPAYSATNGTVSMRSMLYPVRPGDMQSKDYEDRKKAKEAESSRLKLRELVLRFKEKVAPSAKRG